MSACVSPTIVNGVPAGGSSSDPTRVNIQRQTTDATPLFISIATLPNIGDTVAFDVSIIGKLDGALNAQQGLWMYLWQTASRSANGMFGNMGGGIGPNGYTDLVGPPWTTPGAPPAGWGVNTVIVSGNQFGFEVFGPAATTITWRIGGSRNLGGTATP